MRLRGDSHHRFLLLNPCIPGRPQQRLPTQQQQRAGPLHAAAIRWNYWVSSSSAIPIIPPNNPLRPAFPFPSLFKPPARPAALRS